MLILMCNVNIHAIYRFIYLMHFLIYVFMCACVCVSIYPYRHICVCVCKNRYTHMFFFLFVFVHLCMYLEQTRTLSSSPTHTCTHALSLSHHYCAKEERWANACTESAHAESWIQKNALLLSLSR